MHECLCARKRACALARAHAGLWVGAHVHAHTSRMSVSMMQWQCQSKGGSTNLHELVSDEQPQPAHCSCSITCCRPLTAASGRSTTRAGSVGEDRVACAETEDRVIFCFCERTHSCLGRWCLRRCWRVSLVMRPPQRVALPSHCRQRGWESSDFATVLCRRGKISFSFEAVSPPHHERARPFFGI